MNGLKYLISYLLPLILLTSLLSDTWTAWLAPLFVWIMLPLLELIATAPTDNHAAEDEDRLKSNRWYDYLVYSMVPIQWGLMAFFLWRITTFEQPVWLTVAHTIAMGIGCGGLGINVAHELGHRRRRYEQTMSKMLLASTCYMHFFVEHNRGHHTRVATEDDPASARYGESVYAFLPRSIIGSFRDAWELEVKRLHAIEAPVWSWKNEMVRMGVAQGAILAVIGGVFGPIGLAGFLAASCIGILMLEVVNYIEHYGLSRRLVGEGRYERVLPVHSWNSNHLLGRMVLFELTRHSDHHANARRRYQVLRHFEESPQLPTGYPGMMVLAVVPPLWRRVMHPHIEAYRARFLGEAPPVQTPDARRPARNVAPTPAHA